MLQPPQRGTPIYISYLKYIEVAQRKEEWAYFHSPIDSSETRIAVLLQDIAECGAMEIYLRDNSTSM